MVTVTPETAQTKGVNELKVTGNPDEADAVSVIGVALNVWEPGLDSVIV